MVAGEAHKTLIVTTPSENMSWLAPALFAASLFIFDFWLFYPRLVTFDSIRQYQEAVSGHFTETHPPVLAALWRLLLPLSPDARPILALNLALYWSSFAALGILCARSLNRRWAFVAVFAGLFPFLLSFSGVIWKDVTLASAWGLGCALLLLSCSLQGNRRLFRTLWIASATLIIFGSAIRHNAPPAAVILAIALVLPLAVNRVWRLVIFAAIAAAVTLAVPVSNRLLHAKETAPFQMLVQWDLAGISYFSGRNMQDDSTQLLRAHALDCYSPRVNFCPWVHFTSTSEAARRWSDAIETEPLAYLKHRSLVFAMLLRFGCSQCHPYVWESGSQHNPPSLGYQPNPVRKRLGYILFELGKTPLSRPYLWLVAALGLATMLWRKRPAPNARMLALIALSGAVYELTYAVATLTDEFRYTYWLIYSVVFVATAWFFGGGFRWRDLLAWIAVPMLIAFAAGTLVQHAWPTDIIAPSMAAIY